MYISSEKISKYPNHQELCWTDELQGVTRHDNYWFITQQKRLWKIPVSHDLNFKIETNDPQKDILSVAIPPELSCDYKHFRNIYYFEDFLFVAMKEKKSLATVKLACFIASTLEYIGMTIA